MTFRTDAEMCPDANDPMLKHEAALIEEGSKCLKALAEAKAENERLKSSNGNAFVAGAKWWEFKKTGATMWPEDQRAAEAEAERREYAFRTVEEEAYHAEITRLQQGEVAADAEIERLSKVVQFLRTQTGLVETDGILKAISVYKEYVALKTRVESLQSVYDRFRHMDTLFCDPHNEGSMLQIAGEFWRAIKQALYPQSADGENL